MSSQLLKFDDARNVLLTLNRRCGGVVGLYQPGRRDEVIAPYENKVWFVNRSIE